MPAPDRVDLNQSVLLSSGEQRPLSALVQDRPLVLIFLRHFG
ncbi:MAG TPA: hypothetical protein PLO61_05175 [Fimbriimonadaceae bacterium]|nr:hypothetical protein [Fimbriimonadaceae bacterium]